VHPLPTRNAIFRAIWTADAHVSSGLFEIWAGMRRFGSAYSSFLYRYFRFTGLSRHVFGLLDDGATFAVIIAFALLAYALPPFSGTGDVWNRGRAYAVTFTDKDGNFIGQRGIRQDDAIPLAEVAPLMISAVLATEDARFFDHFGVDVIGTTRAIVRNARANGAKQGGSSITQQVAKNLFLSPEKTIRRKVHEAFLSMWIEARLPKEDILKLYLDRSYLGGGNYGVEAAAQFYFGKSIRDVTLPEAAILAGLFKAPTTYAPHQNLQASLGRANVVLYRMLDAGFITQGELLQAQRRPPHILATKDLTSPDWYLDYAYQDTLDVIETYGLQKEYVIEVKTTIDTKTQSQAQTVINDVVDTLGPAGNFTQGASITMSPEGAVRAVVGGRNYADSQFNRATNAERQSGSAFKPFVYMAALLDGFEPDQMMVDSPVSVGGWSPGNYNGKYGGRTTLANALARSFNSIPVKLMQAIGRPLIIETAHRAGIQGALETWPPMVLGTSSLTLLDLTTGYATFAGNGKLAKPYAVLEIRKPNGELIYDRAVHAKPAEQVFPEERVAALNSMLSSVVKSGTGRGADLGFAPQGGKTGTNQGYRDAWYVGFTANNVTGVWVGNDDFSPMNEITGGKIPAPAWKRIMEVAEASQPPRGLAGIPLDETYTTQIAAVPELAPIPDETEAATDVATDPATETSNDVLDGMLSIFADTEPDAPNDIVIARPLQVQKAKAVATPSQTDYLGLPPRKQTRARQRQDDVVFVRPQRRSFVDRIFNNSDRPRKVKKRKPLFNFGF
jgi:penicillin-binding protein 1A